MIWPTVLLINEFCILVMFGVLTMFTVSFYVINISLSNLHPMKMGDYMLKVLYLKHMYSVDYKDIKSQDLLDMWDKLGHFKPLL